MSDRLRMRSGTSFDTQRLTATRSSSVQFSSATSEQFWAAANPCGVRIQRGASRISRPSWARSGSTSATPPSSATDHCGSVRPLRPGAHSLRTMSGRSPRSISSSVRRCPTWLRFWPPTGAPREGRAYPYVPFGKRHSQSSVRVVNYPASLKAPCSPSITICVPITARIRPIMRVITPSALAPM